jgi:hypothetical protein
LYGGLLYAVVFGRVWQEAMINDKGRVKWRSPGAQSMAIISVWDTLLGYIKLLFIAWTVDSLVFQSTGEAALFGAMLAVGMNISQFFMDAAWEDKPLALAWINSARALGDCVVASVVFNYWFN